MLHPSEPFSPPPVEVGGALTSETLPAARGRLLEAMQSAERGNVVLDLAAVSEIDVGGLQLLLAARAWATAHERGFVIVNATAAVRDLCELLGQSTEELGLSAS